MAKSYFPFPSTLAFLSVASAFNSISLILLGTSTLYSFLVVSSMFSSPTLRLFRVVSDFLVSSLVIFTLYIIPSLPVMVLVPVLP